MKKLRILVTGSEGFVGSHLVKLLRQQGHDVVALTKEDGDVASVQFAPGQIDHVFHLAAKTYVPNSWENPEEYYRTNVLGTAHILELCKKQKCSLTFNSTYVYGNEKKMPISEEAFVDPASPYHHSKVLAEDLCNFYQRNFKLRIVILRPFNIYGPGQKTVFIIPKLLSQIRDTKTRAIEIFDAKPKRDYLFIDDFVSALTATIYAKQSGIYNVGSGISHSVTEVISMLFDICKTKKSVVTKAGAKKSAVMDTVADISKIERELGWRPTIDLREGLTRMVEQLSHETN